MAPAAMAWADVPDAAAEFGGESSKTTHGSPECVDACRFFARLLAEAIGGADKLSLVSPRDVVGSDGVRRVASGSYLEKDIGSIRGSGYVVECLEAALWAFATTDDFASAVLAAANLGDDADTTAAVAGQIAGAHYGYRPADQRRCTEVANALWADLSQM